MTTSTPARRLLLVHAHPDDESIGTGATMARYTAEGAQVTLLTCTLGEEGEILVPELAQLAADRADQLGGYRIGELAAAMRELGVSDHRFLGGAGRFRDSGMAGTPANDDPRALWRADHDPEIFAAAVRAVVEVIREVRPQVLITYDPNGDYGHPDHIMAHQVAIAGAGAAADPSYAGASPWTIAKLYWTATPRSVLRRAFAALRANGGPFLGVDQVEELPFGVEDDVVTTAIDGSRYGAQKRAALTAHATQITVDGAFFALSDQLAREAGAVEYFRLAEGTLGPDRDDDGRERDLFSGVETT
jgi:N-acetyl-1-D-myo-inositol-2-amino-2-deoxy-alpha-D-glucopyranoside deacetylase